jgi:hypothetical protein
MATRPLRIVVTAEMDGFANSTKPLLIENVLSKRGHAVTIIDTRYLSRAAVRGPLRALPSPTPRRLLLYLVGLAAHVFSLLPSRLSSPLNSYLYVLKMKLRGRVLSRLICNYEQPRHAGRSTGTPFDIVICESQLDSALMLYDLPGMTKIYNCATPIADELLFGGMLTDGGHKRLRSLEVETFKRSNHLSFHWHSYADYVKKYYDYDVANIFTFDRVVQVSASPARLNLPPRVVYIGALSGYWIDLELLSKLTSLYPYIDVYGLPKPPPKLGLNYKGYASVDVLRHYQFGLITSSKDRLRREGFSAKHIDYLAAGLPVLAPEWRTSAADLKGTIFYTPENFVDQLQRYSREDTWTMVAKEALEQAADYSAERAMGEFIEVVEDASRAPVAVSPRAFQQK